MKIWGSSNATRTESCLPILVKRLTDGRAGMERVLVHSRRPDFAGPLTRLDGPDAGLYPRGLGPGARRLLRQDELAVAELGSSNRVSAVHVFLLVLDTPPVDVAGVCAVDGRVCIFRARSLDANHIRARALCRDFLHQPRPGG